jgi:myo-inositol-1(or 4)-monophosphatase
MKILEAIQFAAKKHKGQERRGTKLPYVIHPIIVMELIQKFKGDSKHIEELKIAGLLHDVFEDTNATYFEVEQKFGSLVASIVMELTSDEKMIEKLGKNEYLKQKMINMSKYAFILKLLDRYSNILDNPAKKYVDLTIDMMEFLKENRKDITTLQLEIINLIIQECELIKLRKEHNRTMDLT